MFIDRKGVIRAQHGGEADFFKEADQEKNTREMIESLLKEKAAAAPKKAPLRAAKK